MKKGTFQIQFFPRLAQEEHSGPHTVEQGILEELSYVRVIFAYAADDFSEIV